MAHTKSGVFLRTNRQQRNGSLCYIATLDMAPATMLHVFVKRHAQDCIVLGPTSIEGNKLYGLYAHMTAKGGMLFSTPPSQPRQGVATCLLLQVQPVRATTHIP